MNLVDLANDALITTQQLFVMYCKHLEGKFDVNDFIEKLNKTNGVFVGYEDISAYKKITASLS